MELRQLEYFCMVSKFNSFTRAAEQMHVAQPSVTSAIHKLEAELGLQLFDRSQKKVMLTAEGQIFQQHATKILHEVRETLVEMHDFSNISKGTIKIGVPPMIGAYIFPDIFTHFKKMYPGIKLFMFEEGSLSALHKLETAELDLGLVILPAVTGMLHTMPVMSQEIVLCVSPAHPLAASSTVSFSQLRNEDFILLKEDSFHRQVIMDRCHQHRFEPRVVFSSNQVQTIKGLVAKGVGITFLMRMVIQDNPNIVPISLTEPLIISIGLVWKKDKYLSKAAKALTDFIKDYPSVYQFPI